MLHTPCTHRTPTPHAHQGRRVATGAAGHLQIYTKIYQEYTRDYNRDTTMNNQFVPVCTNPYQSILVHTSLYWVLLAARPTYCVPPCVLFSPIALEGFTDSYLGIPFSESPDKLVGPGVFRRCA